MQAQRSYEAETIEPVPESIELTILMPCLNERATVVDCVRKAFSFLAVHGVRGEVLVADNGSIDGSQFLANAAGARVIEVFTRGYGAALMAGIASARGRYVIMADTDGSYDFRDLGGMLALLRRGNNLVVGNRFAGGIEDGAMPFLHRYLGNPVLSFLGRLFFSARIGDFHCGLRGFSTEAVRDLRLSARGMEFASEMIVKASLARLSIGEIPIRLSRDGREGPSHLRTWSDGWRHLRFLLSYSPRWLFAYPGGVVVVLGVIGMLWSAKGDDASADILGLFVGSSGIVLGSNLIALGLFVRRWTGASGMLPTRSQLHRIISGPTPDGLLRSALIILVAGLGGLAWGVGHASSLRDGPAGTIILVLSTLAVSLAVQLGAAAFLEIIVSLSGARSERT